MITRSMLALATLAFAACASSPEPGPAPQQPVQPAAQPLDPDTEQLRLPPTRESTADWPSSAERVVAEVPEQPQGLLVAHAPNSTVRPAHREFSDDLLARLEGPSGFTIDVFARDLEEPRGMTIGPDGSLYVAERKAGRVRLLRDTDNDGRADVSRAVHDGAREDLRGVHDLIVHDGHMYLVTESELLRAPIRHDGSLGDTEHLQDIPAGGQHPNRTLGLGPDGTLYLSIGSTCNACVEPQDDHAALHRITSDGTDREIHAEGLRNTLGFAWHPETGDMWGFDHNSDGRGDQWPPEELNRILPDRHYGWPFCGGEREPDHQVSADPTDPRPMTKQEFCDTTEPAVLSHTAHSAPMQMVFYTGDNFPAEYRNDAFVTMRGSWNRNPPTGYEVVRVRFDTAGNPTAIEPFVTGWLIDDGRAHFGRVMGLAQADDGSLYVGDDTNGVIYRVRFEGNEIR